MVVKSATTKGAPKVSTKASATKTASAAKAKKTSAASKAEAAATQKAKKAVAVANSPVPPLDKLGVPGVFPLDALEEIRTPTQAGQVFRLDGGFLDGLALQARRYISAEGTAGLRLNFKISGPSRKEFGARLTKKKAKREVVSFIGAEAQKKGKDIVLVQNQEKSTLGTYYSSHKADNTSSAPQEALVLEGTGWRLQFVPHDGPKALRGAVSIELEGTEAEQEKALAQAIQQAGLQQVFAPCTEVAIRRFALMKLLWTLDPDAAEKLANQGVLSDLKLSCIESALKYAGATP